MNKNRNQCQRFSPYLHSAGKRCFDLSVGLVLLLPGLPLMLIVAAVVWLVDGWPVLFIQWRIGKNGQPFRMPKFRTLCHSAQQHAISPCHPDDVRITPLGRILRPYRLDELPQLFCVLFSRMSLVGPRPDLPHIVATYTPYHTQRLIAKPGLTGLWQIYGNRSIPIHYDMKYDLYYLRKAGLWLDSKLLFMTVGFVLGSKPNQADYK